MLRKLSFILFFCVIGFFITQEIQDYFDNRVTKIHLLKEMFSEMVIKKDASLIPKYYHKDFLLYTNGIEMDYSAYVTMHENIYKSSIEYSVKYDDETLFDKADKVAGRIWITTKKPGELVKEIEVLLIAEYKEDKLYRLWELTYPDWSKLPEFTEDSK